MPWLAAKFLGVGRWVWLLVIAAALVAGYLWLQAKENADDEMNREIGAIEQREGDLRETLDRVEKADEVRETVQPGSRAMYDECLRSARTPANCERFLPDRQGD